MDEKADIGLIGLAVMGENLALNMADKGWRVAVHNRSLDKVDAFLRDRAHNKPIIKARSLSEMVLQLAKPRKILLMVKAGAAVDDLLDRLIPLLGPEDIVIDGGNSHFSDSARRSLRLAEKGLLFVGAGISGGEEGALLGPSIMPGGHEEAWPEIEPVFSSIAARAADGSVCCAWLGSSGAGHFIKMVHNGIEYADMQLIAEAFDILRRLGGLDPEAISRIFSHWNQGDLSSYLLQITADILAKKEEGDGGMLVDSILDVAGEKGTGRWTAIAALDLGVPAGTIAEAVFARAISARKAQRVKSHTLLPGPQPDTTNPPDKAQQDALVQDAFDALHGAKLVALAQGFALLQDANRQYGWDIDQAKVASIWRGGCIIRTAFLDRIASVFAERPELDNVLIDPAFHAPMAASQTGWRRTVAKAMQSGLPVPGLASALSWYDAYRSRCLPANLIQAQRDYFGAHRYERNDRPRGEFFHTRWTEIGHRDPPNPSDSEEDR
ncbi:decarboxylating NADP(+)-dependent phosphogluconate dehydrogenase [Thioalkalivibrio sp. HK1]|uniref:decarboxylating NADP(+)-dependent phosphogluconate dehydrogenase n=1 Tax=Thioalkalivibrio sp. HK1 TaxID=1469245 RepID=UPI000472517F|nr:decarboxylating NADP(+)-dependent phosphogluconate dehydrogenase [Thioalkalivibrio sp. HK1]